MQDAIIEMLRLHDCEVWRINVMATKYKGKDGKDRYVRSTDKGFPDLFGVKLSDQKAFFIEVKRPKGGVISPAQWDYHLRLMHDRTIHGIAKSVDDALKIVDGELIGYGYSTTRRARR